MSRQRLRLALREPAARQAALVPLIERQLGPLIGIGGDRMGEDPELAARAFRTAAGLYPVDGLTIGASGTWLSVAVSAADPSPAEGPASLPLRCEPQTVARRPGVRFIPDIIVRLRPVLGDRVGLVVVLPTPDRLVHELNVSGAAGRRWAVDVLMSVLREIGEHEPDAVFLRPTRSGVPASPGEPGHGLETVADHFDLPIVRLADATADVLLLDPDEVLDLDAGRPIPRTTRIVSTTDEIREEAPPGMVRAAMERLQAVMGAGR